MTQKQVLNAHRKLDESHQELYQAIKWATQNPESFSMFSWQRRVKKLDKQIRRLRAKLKQHYNFEHRSEATVCSPFSYYEHKLAR